MRMLKIYIQRKEIALNVNYIRILMLLNKRQLEKLKEDWWKNDEFQKTCEKPEDQSDGISIQNIGGVFIVIFVGIGMAWYVQLCCYLYSQ